MGTPAELLQAFWQELRGRTRVIIDHRDLPDALKDVAAEAIKTIWLAANEAASRERAALRAETAAAREEALALSAQLGEARQAQGAVQAELWRRSARHTPRRGRDGRPGERNWRPRAASWQNCEPNSRRSAREQVAIAQERAEASARRALRSSPAATRPARDRAPDGRA